MIVNKILKRWMIIVLWSCLFCGGLRADELHLKDGTTAIYESIFSMDEGGVTLEKKEGLEFVSWQAMYQEDAELLSRGKYQEWIQKSQRKIPTQSNTQVPPLPETSTRIEKPLSQEVNTPETPLLSPTLSLSGQVTSSAQIEEWLDPKGAIFHITPEEFLKWQKGNGFDWISKDTLELYSRSHHLHFFGLDVWEAHMQIQGNSIHKMILNLYNRADAGNLDEIAFDQLRYQVMEALRGWLGRDGIEVKAGRDRSRFTESHWIGQKSPYRLDLFWSISKENGQYLQSEYIRLEITESHRELKKEELMIRSSVSEKPGFSIQARDLIKNVKRLANGDVYIQGIPMVDQGERGYCAVAVAERILRYYGHEIDQHRFAQYAGSDTQKGTQRSILTDVLHQLGYQKNISVKNIYEMDTKEFIYWITKYAKYAERAGVKRLSFNESVETLSEFFKKVDWNLLKKIRLMKTVDMKKFKDDVAKYTGAGVPLAWGVIAGTVKEHPPVRGVGSHLRIILGINLNTSELLYTDTWGPGHEMKRMQIEDAWAITLAVEAVTPRRWHYWDPRIQIGLSEKASS